MRVWYSSPCEKRTYEDRNFTVASFYPKPLHLHKAAKKFKYKKGQFKNAENLSKKVISIPVHEFVNRKQLNFIISKIFKFIFSDTKLQDKSLLHQYVGC